MCERRRAPAPEGGLYIAGWYVPTCAMLKPRFAKPLHYLHYLSRAEFLLENHEKSRGDGGERGVRCEQMYSQLRVSLQPSTNLPRRTTYYPYKLIDHMGEPGKGHGWGVRVPEMPTKRLAERAEPP